MRTCQTLWGLACLLQVRPDLRRRETSYERYIDARVQVLSANTRIPVAKICHQYASHAVRLTRNLSGIGAGESTNKAMYVAHVIEPHVKHVPQFEHKPLPFQGVSESREQFRAHPIEFLPPPVPAAPRPSLRFEGESSSTPDRG